MSRPLVRSGRLVVGAVIIAVLVWRLGTGPFLSGLRAVDGRSLVAAVGIAVVTTTCSAWRWTLVARGLGVGLPLRTAITAYYRSQFLNTVLPGGVVGDVHRAVRHGRDVGEVGRCVRAVAYERVAGQAVQLALAAVLLAALPSPVRGSVPLVGAAVLVVVIAAAIAARIAPHRPASRIAGLARAAVTDVRRGVLARGAWPGITLASVVVVAGHTATFLIAARTAGSAAPLASLLPVAVLVMLAMAIPANVGGWGPREGVAAWSFAAAGLGADQGVATATLYGVLVLAASLPGAVVLAASRRRVGKDGSPGRAARPAAVEVSACG